MKKFFLGGIAILAMSIVFATKVKFDTYSSTSDVLMSNVEALAQQTESSTGYADVMCTSVEAVDAAGNKYRQTNIVCEGIGKLSCSC